MIPPLVSFIGGTMKGRQEYLSLLQGSGIEIGALHRPSNVPHLKVKYVDRMTREDLFKQYPELIGYDVVEADILDDAERLATIPNESQDFVLANHVIEHMANPIGALEHWLRVLRPGGRLFLAAPDRDFTFDKDRDLTPFDHILDDYRAPSLERDYLHFEDFAQKVSCRVFNVRPESESQQFARELWDMKYSIHYHVWVYQTFLQFLEGAQRILQDVRFQVVSSMETRDDEFIVVLERLP